MARITRAMVFQESTMEKERGKEVMIKIMDFWDLIKQGKQ